MKTLAVDKPWLMLGDCLERMAEIPDGSVDMIMADLPYQTTACHWDSLIPFDLLWAHYRRVIRRNGAIVLTSSQPFTTSLIASNMAWFKYCWVWEKTRPGDVFNAKNKPLKTHEDVCVFSSGTTANGSRNRMPYFPQGVTPPTRGISDRNNKRNAAFRGVRPSHTDDYTPQATNYPRSIIRISNSNKGSLHPTQKPVPLFEYLILTYTNEYDVVLDNCSGSFTTGVACINTGRKFIGIEKDASYFEIGRRRIKEAIAKAAQPAPYGGLFDAQAAD